MPGTGRLFVQSVNARDYGLIMGTTLFYARVIVVANMVVDSGYAFVDPRIRYSMTALRPRAPVTRSFD